MYKRQVLLDLRHVLQREVVRALVGHGHRVTGGRVGAGVAVVFDVALRALQFAVIAAEGRDLAREATFAQVLDLDLRTLGVLVPQRVLLGPRQRLDQAVANDSRLGACLLYTSRCV